MYWYMYMHNYVHAHTSTSRCVCTCMIVHPHAWNRHSQGVRAVDDKLCQIPPTNRHAPKTRPKRRCSDTVNALCQHPQCTCQSPQMHLPTPTLEEKTKKLIHSTFQQTATGNGYVYDISPTSQANDRHLGRRRQGALSRRDIS